jgi:hypothetical protein
MADKPHFIIKNKFQKRSDLYQDILTPNILTNVCQRITGMNDYTCTFDNSGYNKGRMATLYYSGKVFFISFSDTESAGRNASMQSVPSALISYYEETNPQKEIYFYFLPSSGNYETNYFYFMYRLMLTAGVNFLNHADYLSQPLHPFNSVEDVIYARNVNREKNQSNNSSYVTKSSNHLIQIYGKTYGANKYETTLFCVAFSRISNSKIELYQICEQDLKAIPKRCADVINSLGNVNIIQTDLTMERNSFEREDSLRSPRYIYNLLSRLGAKKCAFCRCEIPELIQGAHIWAVADIKRMGGISLEQKIKYATDGNNGLWLCENHHKMLDEGIITIDIKGSVHHNPDIIGKNLDFINWSTPITKLEPHVMTDTFISYLKKRNGLVA